MKAVLTSTLLVLLCGCLQSGTMARAKSPGSQLVVFQLYAPKGVELPKQTGIYLITDKAVCGTRLEHTKKTLVKSETVYCGELLTTIGSKRYMIVQCPKEDAQVFVLTTQVTPSGLDWIPCAKPDFIDKSEEPSWSLSNSINKDKQSRDIPCPPVTLRYRVQARDLP